MRKTYSVGVVGVILLMSLGGFSGITSAADEDIAAQFAPILYFEGSEQCYPVDVSYAIENSYLYQVGNDTPLATTVTAEMLSLITVDDFYLDNQKGTVDDNGIITDYQSNMDSLGYTVYAHVDSTLGVVQYWFFYTFNAGDLNRHEGDWEMIQVQYSGDQPTTVMFSQHYSGQKATWSQVDKDGTHVKVYVARGSHANYIRSYSGKVGLASDSVGANGKVLQPTDYTIEVLTNQSWLSFGGRWGWVGADQSQAAEAVLLGEAGPNGPMYREDGLMWQPLSWAAGLQDANDTLFIVEWLVYNFVMLMVLITLLSLALLGFLVYRRHKRYGLGPRKLSLLYIDGVNLKSIGNILCIVAIVVAFIGVFLPWYTVTANVSIPQYQSNGTFTALSIDGLNGLQVRLPDSSGPLPLGTFAMPFYILIVIGLVFLVLATLGVAKSKKLGLKYVFRGVRLFIPFILVFIVIMLAGQLITMVAPSSIRGNTEMFNAANAISAAPMGGGYTVTISEVQGTVALQWGVGVGIYLMLLAGILLIVAGIIEVMAKTTFFEPKVFEKTKEKKTQK